MQNSLLGVPSPRQILLEEYVGKDLRAIAGPAAVVDRSVAKKNCQDMLDTVDSLGMSWRAHVKTHKTAEMAQMQVGAHPRPVKLVVSTVAEAEHLLPFLLECKKHDREANVLYGIPPSSTCFARLMKIREQLGSDSISFLIDHPAQLQNLVTDRLDESVDSAPMSLFLKVDAGYHRAGLPPDSEQFKILVQAVEHAEKASSQPRVRLQGFYSHLSTSYQNQTPEESLEHLRVEIQSCLDAAKHTVTSKGRRLTVSVGATPTVSSAQNLLSKKPSETAAEVKAFIGKVQESYELELHAGVYPFLDVQQLATHARPRVAQAGDFVATMTEENIGLRILAEVLSLYDTRDKPEALVGAGTLALGREPCRSYAGWGIVAPSPWHIGHRQAFDEANGTGWVVDRISQEHGILAWAGARGSMRQLSIGEKVLIWPNHACIAAAGYGFFLVVDEKIEAGTQVVDVWVRCRGW